jgi:hypothetical protein
MTRTEIFANKIGLKMTILDCSYGFHFADDTNKRYIFRIKLQRGRKSFTFNFGQSVFSGNTEPSLYDVVSCLQKYDVGSFEDFCNEFGYDTDSRKAEKIYKAVCKEYQAVERLFGDVMEELNEIQ